jgi:hypothetical protein
LILEGIVTTISAEGILNVAPMGPRVGDGMKTLLLRPFQTSNTYRNLKAVPEGVFHVTDDALMLARAAIGLEVDPPRSPARVIRGQVLTGACRYYEFRVRSTDDREDRASIEAQTVAEGTLRPFFGWNRAKHAVLEAAILATRVAILPREDILAEMDRLKSLIDKTGGAGEHAAFELLLRHVSTAPTPPSPHAGSILSPR